VSFADKVRDKTQALRGRMKRNTGEVTATGVFRPRAGPMR
jgi:hypothetical protein